MFFVHDVHGQQHAYGQALPAVGLRPTGVTRAVGLRKLGVGEQPPEVPMTFAQAPRGKPHSATSPPPRQLLLVVEQIMSQPVVNIRADSSVKDANELLGRARVRHLPVLSSDGRVVGLLSQRDVLSHFSVDAKGQATRVAEVMTTQVLVTRPGVGIREVARTMFEAKVGSLPVIEEGGSLVGIVTRSDILRALIEHAPLQLWG